MPNGHSATDMSNKQRSENSQTFQSKKSKANLPNHKMKC